MYYQNFISRKKLQKYLDIYSFRYINQYFIFKFNFLKKSKILFKTLMKFAVWYFVQCIKHLVF